MPPPRHTKDERSRLAVIDRFRLGGRGREPEFDRVTSLAADLFGVAASTVSIIGAEEQCFRGASGIDAWGTPRDVALCAYTILGDEITVVEDAAEDERFSDNPIVFGPPHVRFYAGAPLKVGGESVGALCIFDPEPRSFSDTEQRRLRELADIVVDLIQSRTGTIKAEEQRQLLSLTVENVVEGVALVDGELRMVLWNQAFCDMFGYEARVVSEGMNAAELITLTARRGDLGKGDPAEIARGFVESIMSSDSRRIEVQRSDGRILDIWRKTIPGRHFILTARDVTEERQIGRLKDELVSTVSHELRTPLTAICGSLGLIASGNAGELSAKARHLVDIAHKNSDRLTQLVNDLLDLDKLQSGKMDFTYLDVDLREVAQSAVEQNGPYAERFGVTLRTDLPAEPIYAYIDEKRMLQVLTNLLSNAAKFSPAGKEVLVRLRKGGKGARISVIDEGAGVPPDFRKHLFGRFAQADQSSRRGQAGTGLGLAISKNIVERHGGRIALDVETQVGATFHIDLPVTQGRRRVPRTITHSAV